MGITRWRDALAEKKNPVPNGIPNVKLRFGEFQFTSDNGCTDVH